MYIGALVDSTTACGKSIKISELLETPTYTKQDSNLPLPSPFPFSAQLSYDHQFHDWNSNVDFSGKISTQHQSSLLRIGNKNSTQKKKQKFTEQFYIGFNPIT